jgi:hypothetical protein
MMTLVLIALLAVAFTSTLRKCGVSRGLSFAIPTVPFLGFFLYCVIRSDIAFGPHGVIAGWLFAGCLLVVVGAASAITAGMTKAKTK